MAYKFNPFTGTFDDVADVAEKVESSSGSSTDNAIVRWDSNTGLLIQDSSVIIDDSNNITGVNNLTVTGDLTVNGTTTSINTTNLEVEDANITMNNNGNQASADNIAGLTIEMSDNLDASLVYQSSLASRFKIGDIGFESEIITSAPTQTILGTKTFLTLQMSSATANTVSIFNASNQLVSSTITDTELSYLDNVTSNIQTQLDSKAVITDVFSINSTSGTDTLTANETYIVDTSSSVATLTLPAASADTFVRIKDSGNAENFNITIQTPGAETIDGAATHVINSNYGSVVIVSDGTNFYIL